MKDSGIAWIGKIPKEWELKKGKNLFEQVSQKGNLRCLQLLSPTQNYGVIPQSLYEEQSGMSAVKLNSNVDLNDLKTVHVGAFCISLRSFQGGFEYSRYEGVVSNAYQIFYGKAGVYDHYYRYLFKDSSFIEKMNSYTMSLRDGKNIAFTDFGNTLIPYPSFEEQQQIANFLDAKCAEIDGVVADIRKEIELLKEYRKSVIYEAVTKGLDPNAELKDSNVTWIGKIPKSWSLVPLKYCFVIENGSDPITSEGDIPVYGSGSKSFKTCKEYKEGPTVLLGRKGTVNIPQWVEGKYWNVDTAFNTIPRENYDFRLFYYAACCFDYDNYSTQTALPSMTQTTYYSFYLPKMNNIEQQQIVSYLDAKCAEIDALVSDKQQQIEKLNEYKKSLIYEYITGKKEVPAV